tara:strand:+ start:1435 stop:1776 length:342 start_codon:yes stop_codon:yes gene_type:complete
MTIQYKNQGFNLTTSNLTTVLTIATSAVAIVKSISLSNISTNNVLTQCKLRDRSASADFEFFRNNNNSSSTMQATVEPLNLEAGDGIKVQAESANVIQGVISYALLDRSQENG